MSSMQRRNIPHLCITCEHHDGIHYHCKAHDSYVSYEHAFSESNKCKDWELSVNYKKGGKFYEQKDGDE